MVDLVESVVQFGERTRRSDLMDPRQLMNGAWIDRPDVEFTVGVVDYDQVAFFDSEQAREPLLNHDLQTIPINVRDSSRALDELISTGVERDADRELAINLLNRSL